MPHLKPMVYLAHVRSGDIARGMRADAAKGKGQGGSQELETQFSKPPAA